MAKKKPTTTKRKMKPAASPGLVAQQVRLRDLRLCKSACALGTVRASELKQTITLKITPKADEPNAVVVWAEFVLLGENPNGQEGLHIEATFWILYAVDPIGSFDPDELGALLSPIALTNAWPYWREFAHSMTVRMGLPALRVPLLRPDQMPPTQTIRKGASQMRPKEDPS